jgi:hypothetical protein
MKLSSRIASVAATGLVALVLPAHAVTMPAGTDTASVPNANTARQLGQRSESPAFFKRSSSKKKKPKK